MKKIYANNLTTLSLGRQGENLARQVVFDLSAWEAEYGPGVAELIHQRSGDAQPYPLAVQRDGTLVTWDVTATDTEMSAATANERYGKCELRYYAGETLAKSQIWRTWVESAMDAPSETAPPEPEQGWVDQVLAVGVSVKEATDSAKTYSNSAEQSASGAAQSAQEAAESASAAQQSATSAAESAAVYDNVVSDVNQLKEDVEHLAPTIVCEASGDVITLDDSCDRPFSGLNIYGKTTQDGTPSPDSPVPLVSVGAGGSVAITVSDGTSNQMLTVQTPNGLPGIPVSSGGNYTDASGQQWICDEVDFARGVYVQRVLRKLFDGSEKWIDAGTIKGNVRPTNTLSEIIVKAPDALTKVSSFCDFYQLRSSSETWEEKIGYSVSDKSNSIQFYDSNFTTLSSWKAYLAENPVTCLLQLASPIETAISAEELAQYAALYTNQLNTTVYNDAGAWMKVGYQADTKLYIDKQFAELRNAIVALGGNV